jgi:hypothetical protein
MNESFNPSIDVCSLALKLERLLGGAKEHGGHFELCSYNYCWQFSK